VTSPPYSKLQKELNPLVQQHVSKQPPFKGGKRGGGEVAKIDGLCLTKNKYGGRGKTGGARQKKRFVGAQKGPARHSSRGRNSIIFGGVEHRCKRGERSTSKKNISSWVRKKTILRELTMRIAFGEKKKPKTRYYDEKIFNNRGGRES